MIFHSHLPKLDSLVFDILTRGYLVLSFKLINFAENNRTRKSKEIKSRRPRIARQKAGESRIISANYETVNCGKRGPVKAINADRTATAASNFFLPLKKTANGIPSELSKFDFLARSRTARATKCYFHVRADHLCVPV